ncbi:IS110 family transposase, partial [Staphylococcus epidermidis]
TVKKKTEKTFILVVCDEIKGTPHYDQHVVDLYNKLKKQPNEKPQKTAIISCINRLLKTIHYLVMNHKLYDYQMSPH